MLCDYHSYTTWFQQLIATCEFNKVWSIVNPDSSIDTLGNNPAKLDSWLAGLRLEVFNPASQTVSKSRIKPASRKQKA
jgi:hypothetical protein